MYADCVHLYCMMCMPLFMSDQLGIKTRASREMTSQKIRQYLTLTCKTPIPKLLFLIKSLKIWYSCSLILLIL